MTKADLETLKARSQNRKEKKVRVNLYLRKDVYDQFSMFCAEVKTPVSAIVEEMMWDFIIKADVENTVITGNSPTPEDLLIKEILQAVWAYGQTKALTDGDSVLTGFESRLKHAINQKLDEQAAPPATE